MLAVSKELIKNFKIYEAGYDFMGYRFKNLEDLSFHHLIIPKKVCLKNKIGDGYEYWNGVILVRRTAHDYIHLIEEYDNNIYYDITSELIDEKIKGRLDAKNIHYIDLLLKQFEEEYEGMIGYDNDVLIKSKYKKRIFYNER